MVIIPFMLHATGVAAGAGELSSPFASPMTTSLSRSATPDWLLSLATAELSGILTSLELSLFTSPLASTPLVLVGAFQEVIFQTVPVKDLSCRPLRSHLRHGLPVRSSWRSFSLMAPVLALGPRRGAAPTGLLVVGSVERSIVPSGLRFMLLGCAVCNVMRRQGFYATDCVLQCDAQRMSRK